MLPAGLVKSKVMLCRLIFKAITSFFTLLSPCIFNNLLSNDLSPPLPFLLTHSASPSVFSAPAAKCPAASLRLQSPIRPHLAVSFQQPHIHRGCRRKKSKKQNHTHTLPPELTVLAHVCECTRYLCVPLCLPSPTDIFPLALHFNGERLAAPRGDSAGGIAEVRSSPLLSSPPPVSRGSYL